jgi:hypothetical protein
MLHSSVRVIHLDDSNVNAEEVGLDATYFAGNRGLVVEANKKARGCWLKHLVLAVLGRAVVRVVARAVELAVSRTVAVASMTVAVATAAVVDSGGSGGGGGGGGDGGWG